MKKALAIAGVLILLAIGSYYTGIVKYIPVCVMTQSENGTVSDSCDNHWIVFGKTY